MRSRDEAMNDTPMLHELVLEAMANDYESFECIIEQVTIFARNRGRTFTRQETAEALEWAIDEGYAQAYLLSSHPPYFTQIAFSHERLSAQWFYVTSAGKQLVKDLENQVGE